MKHIATFSDHAVLCCFPLLCGRLVHVSLSPTWRSRFIPLDSLLLRPNWIQNVDQNRNRRSLSPSTSPRPAQP